MEQVIAVKEAQGGGGEEGDGGEEGGDGGDQAIRDDADAQEFLASSGEASSASGGTVTALGSMTIASEAEAAQFLQYLSGLGTDAQAISAALGQLDDAGLSYFHGYLEGVIAGTSATTLAPRKTGTRAEVATVLMRFCEQ